MKALGVFIGLLMLAGVSSNLTGGGDTRSVNKPAAPAIVSTPSPPAPAPVPAVQQPAPKPAAPAVAPRPPTTPKQAAPKAPAPAPKPAAKPAAKAYANCSEAKAAGAAPLRRGSPGYSSSLDRDGDGIACEKK